MVVVVQAEDVDYSVSVQAVEIYNEQVQDLLNEDLSGHNSKLEVHLNERGRSCVPDALQVSAKNTQGLQVFEQRSLWILVYSCKENGIFYAQEYARVAFGKNPAKHLE